MECNLQRLMYYDMFVAVSDMCGGSGRRGRLEPFNQLGRKHLHGNHHGIENVFSIAFIPSFSSCRNHPLGLLCYLSM